MELITIDKCHTIPEDIYEALTIYVEKGYPVGNFLTNVLVNDLFGAISRADSTNRKYLTDICLYIYNKIPSKCWGSEEKVQAWMKHNGLSGINKIKVMTERLPIYANNYKDCTLKETEGVIWKDGDNHYLQIGKGKVRYLREEIYNDVVNGTGAQYCSDKYRCNIWKI